MAVSVQSPIVRRSAWAALGAVLLLGLGFLIGRWTDSGGGSSAAPTGVVVTSNARVTACERALGLSNPGRFRFVWHKQDAQFAGVIFRIAALCDSVPSGAAQGCEATGVAKLSYSSSAQAFQQVGAFCSARYPRGSQLSRLPKRAPTTSSS
jgi:hypothetical protein